MPTTASAEEKPKKRAPRKRASGTRTVRKTVAKKAVRKRAPRKRVVKKSAVSTEGGGRRIDSDSRRKAPTPLAANRASSKAKQKRLTILVSIIVFSIGISAAVGFTDQGQIDVNRAIEERNERIRSGQAGANETQRIIVPVQNTEANKKPDGGLVGGFGIPPKAAKPPKEPATTTATSTDETATSSEAITEEVEAEEETTEVLEEATEPEPTTGEEIVVEPTSGR